MKKTAAAVAVTVALAVSGCATLSDTDRAYLDNVRDRLADNPESVMVEADDPALIAAARAACDQLPAAGGDPSAVDVSSSALDSRYIAARAAVYYCRGAVSALDIAISS